jgi:hypothetical protein
VLSKIFLLVYWGRIMQKHIVKNSTGGAVLVRMKPIKIVAEKDTAEWE